MKKRLSLLKYLPLTTAVLLALTCVDLPPSPVAPTFDVQGSIPLLDRVFFASSLTDDSVFTGQPDGTSVFESSEDFDPLTIDTISIQPEASSQQTVLGSFDVQAPSVDPILLSIPGLPPGSTIIPPATFPVPETTIGPLASFEYIEFESGTMSISIQNTLPVAVDFPQPIVIKNNNTSAPVDTAIVASFGFTQIGPGASQVQAADVAGLRMQSALKLPAMDISTPGSGGSTVTIDPGDGLLVQITITGAKAVAAKAQIPTQSILSFADSTFVVDDSLTLQLAFFSAGSFSVEVENNIDVNVGVYVQFAQLQDKITGQPFEIIHQFTGVETRSFPVVMSGLKFQSLVDTIGTQATFTVGVSTINNTDSSREVRSTDFVRVSIVPGPPIKVQQVTGRMKPTPLSISTGSPGFTLGETAEKFEGEFTFDSLEIALRLSTSFGFPTDYDISFVGMNRKTNPPKIDSLVVPPPQGSSQRRLYPATTPVTSIVLDNTAGLNTFLSKFFPNLPDTFIIRGTMVINPPDVYPTPDGLNTIYDTSKVYANVDMAFPIRIGIDNGAIRDTVPLNVREKFPKSFASSTKSGTLYFDIVNRFPFSLEFRSALLRYGPGATVDTLTMIPSDGPRIIPSSPVDGTGSAVDSTISRFAITMTEAQAQFFEISDLMWIELRLETAGNGSVVKLKDSDYVRVRTSANLVYQVNKP